MLHVIAFDLSGVTNIVMIGGVTLDDESEHIQDGIAVFVEAAAWQGITVSHLVGDPQLIKFTEPQFAVLSQCIHQPHIVLELLSYIHNYMLLDEDFLAIPDVNTLGWMRDLLALEVIIKWGFCG